ncbi:MAG: tripartite tricarboxylate transporter TctB family protein [Pseudomonadota bacterium]
MERQQDIALGAIFMALGIAAAWGARAYSGASGTYPLVLGVLLALTGAIVALRALRMTSAVERILIDAPVKLYTAIAIGVIYVALVVPLGFYTASLLLMLGLPVALGFRRYIYALTVGAIFTGIVYIVFSVFLERPLPRELILSLLGSGG